MSCVTNAIPQWIIVVVSAVIGAFGSFLIMRYQETLKILAEFYADVFAAYADCIPSNFYDAKKLMVFIACAEKTKLFCSPESEKILNGMVWAVTRTPPDRKTAKDLFGQLRKSAKKDTKDRTLFPFKRYKH